MDVYVAGTGICLPPSVSVEQAISHGLYDAAEAERTQQQAATVARPGERAPDLAVTAARDAIARSGYRTDDIGVLLHAACLEGGVALANTASYIQRSLGIGGACLAAELRNLCNGGMSALQLASVLLSSPDSPSAGLLTTADIWPPDVIDRWRSGSGGVFGDGGAAIVLSRSGGFARLLSVRTDSDPELEAMFRGTDPFGPFQHSADNPISLRGRARHFLASMGEKEFWRRQDAVFASAARQAVAAADVDLASIEHVLHGFFGRTLLDRQLAPLGVSVDESTWEFGRHIGHLGPGDQFAALHHLVTSGRLLPGERVLIVGSGAGLLCTVAVFEACANVAEQHARPSPPAV